MLALVLSVSWQVASRYLLQAPSSWTEELARFLLVWIGLLGPPMPTASTPTWAWTSSPARPGRWANAT